MSTVVVTGAASPLGRQVRSLLADRTDVDRVVGVDTVGVTGHGVESRRLDVATADLSEVLSGADAVLHLATVFGQEEDPGEVEGAVEVTAARRVLDASVKAGVERVVLVGTAAVYGPWSNNAVPLTEEAPLRPHPELPFAVQAAEIERYAAELAADNPSIRISRLRPATVVADPERCWLADALDSAAKLPPGDEVPAQYLHGDDLASAVVTAWSAGLSGPLNVAPAGWLKPSERLALDPVPRVRLPERVAVALSTWRWRVGLAPTSPGILAYARRPWVVAADRLVEAGWEPTNSNEEAYVAGHEASAIEQISPQRRQEIALGVLGGFVGLSALIGGLVWRRRRRSRK